MNFRASESPQLRRSNFHTSCGLGVLAALASASLSACQLPAPSPPPELADVKALAQRCSATPRAALVELDGTGSSQGEALLDERFTVVHDVALKTAACGGHLRVQVFTSGVSATATVFDGVLSGRGATETARLRQVVKAADDAVDTVRSGYPQAVSSLTQTGSDITAVFRSASEFSAQVRANQNPPPPVSLTVLTDGIDNLSADLQDRTLTQDRARDMAQRQPMEPLPDVAVAFVGIGKVSGAQPPTSYVEALKVFYRDVCAASGAEPCVVVTDYAKGQSR